jgi:HD-like signal output (HDOD) protein/GGDEF domain-containing protein
LRVVNSSLFGLSQEVLNLNQALALLGIKPLKLLVLGFSLPDGLFQDVNQTVLARYWQHTLTKAVAAREISETAWRIPGDDAFVAGLLQDIGVLALLQQLGYPYVRFLQKVLDEGGDLEKLETAAMGFSHVDLTAKLLEAWGLPVTLAAAVRTRITIDEKVAAPEAAESLPYILHLAEQIARLLADDRPDLLNDIVYTGGMCHGMTDAQLAQLIEELQEKVEQLADVLSLELPAGYDYPAILDESRRQLAATALDAAVELVHQRSVVEMARCEALLEKEEVRELTGAVNQFANGKRSAPSTSTITAPMKGMETGPAKRASATATIAASAQPEDNPGLLGRLNVAVAACRQTRRALSLLLIEIDDYDDVVFSHGPGRAASYVRKLEKTCRSLDQPGASFIETREARFGLVLPDCDRLEAVRIGNSLVSAMRQSAAADEDAVTVSVGASTVSMPPKNFAADHLVESADRCLYGARSSGGNSVKSIEIY